MKDLKKQLYEGLYIFHPNLSEDARDRAVKKVIDAIAALGGSHEKTIHWGRRKMAYDIKGCREGQYSLIYFTLPTNGIDELIHGNHLNEDVLRFMHMAIDTVPEKDEIEFKPVVTVER
tara:strand:- start:12 stop:365 length:354 start_codon:yes stop_codon:yes gene_type:complete